MGLLDPQKAKPQDKTGWKVDIVVLYADLREFSKWSNKAKSGEVVELVEIYYSRVIQLMLDYHHTFHKFLGDGFLLLWESNEFRHYEASKCDPVAGALSEALGAAFEIHKKYFYATKTLSYDVPRGFGIGISTGLVHRVSPDTWIERLNQQDYVGYPMNAGARLQSLAGPYGVVLDSRGSAICRKCSEELLSRGHPCLELRLVRPSHLAKKRAAGLKGLEEMDIKDFNYVTWPFLQNGLWKSDGQL